MVLFIAAQGERGQVTLKLHPAYLEINQLQKAIAEYEQQRLEYWGRMVFPLAVFMILVAAFAVSKVRERRRIKRSTESADTEARSA